MQNEFAKCEIKTSAFSGRKPRAGNYCIRLNVAPSGNRSQLHFEAQLSEPVERLEHGLVLDGR